MVQTKQIDLGLDPVCPTKALTVEDGSSSGSQHHSNHDDEVDDVKGESAFGFIMRRREKSRLKMFRGMVAAMLAMTAGVTLVAFFFLKREETRKFETAYDQFARTLANAALDQQKDLRQSLKMMEDMLATSASMAGNGTSPWPYFVPENFEALAMDYKKLANAEFLGLQNFVTHEQRESYVEYISTQYEDFVKDSHMTAYGHLDNLDQNTSRYQPFIQEKLSDGSYVPDSERPFYFARTVQSPPVRQYGQVNNNLIVDEIIGAGFAAVLALKNESVTTPEKPFANLPDAEHAKLHSAGGGENPHSFTFFPVHEDPKDTDSDIVAILSTATAWDVSMQNLLPTGVNGVLCVIKNTCGQSFTYEIQGRSAFYLGGGDWHDPGYDDMGMTVELSLHSHPEFANYPGHCLYTLQVFPTDRFKSDYVTFMPAAFAITVAATFIVVASVFFAYDLIIQRRNDELAKTAARSDKLVSSLFPEGIRDQLLKEQELSDHGVCKKSLDGSVATLGGERTERRTLAKFYPDASVLFADLRGFTAWSSTRTPEDVFELLETLYSSFDAIAAKRGVFKVETIGDCYVAATGLPDPQQDHAERMVKFANECLQKMKTLTTELAETLGEDTRDLSLRVGIHSGGITGGVLRGDKSRFQLFGDTMNTAARMESNGVPERIHVSNETAELLKEADKESWLSIREGGVEAKGKGQLQTWFANPSNAPSLGTKSTMSDASSGTLSGSSNSRADSNSQEFNLYGQLHADG